MGNIYDIKSANVVIGSQAGTTNFGIGAVPTGKQRFVTFVKATNLFQGAGGTNTLYLASHTSSSVASLAAATAAKKMTIPFRLDDEDHTRQVPEGTMDIESPLFVIAGSHCLVGCCSRGSVDVFVRYHDE